MWYNNQNCKYFKKGLAYARVKIRFCPMTTIEKIENLTLPVIPLKGIIAFPAVTINFECVETETLSAAEAALETDSYVLLLAKKKPTEPAFEAGNLYSVGTVAKIKQSVKTPEGHLRIISEGLCRAEVSSLRPFAEYFVAEAICRKITLSGAETVRSQAMTESALSLLEKMVSYLPAPTDDLMLRARSITNVGLLADFIAANVLVKYQDKQEILEKFDPKKRIMALLSIMQKELELLECERDIHKAVRSKLNQNQREYYLREEMKVIQDELGSDTSDTDEYYKRIMDAELPENVKEKLLKENERLAKTPFGSAEAGVMRSYLDVCLDLPWTKTTKDRVSINAAEKILNADHDGLEKVKERILEFLAVKQLSPDLKNQIICLVGPPGVGKTSVAASIARAMNRKYVRVCLGGVRDEADIRGHRKTYIGAMPGRIMNALAQAKVKNPLILLDEIDKLTSDAHGDPASALLEVLDSEQNCAFRDHFVELPFDLSECVFIATANTLDTVPRPLIDRMEVIELKTYTREEKLSIAKHHLIPKQLTRHGLTKKMLSITDSAIKEIIDFYTREAGVRNLERTIASLCRKAAKKIISDGAEIGTVRIKASDVKDYLGARKVYPDLIAEKDEVGTVNGLAYTEVGGDMLKIEAAVLSGSGKIELTGSLGDVMKESAQIAVSYVRSITSEYSIEEDFYKTKDIHIHCPEGAVPKDGPSAGVTMTTALVSALTGIPVRRDVAMTGEITLRGNVLAIGGLKEKTMAAYTAGVKTVFIPADNMKDLPDIDPIARENLKFVPCKHIEDVLSGALAK